MKQNKTYPFRTFFTILGGSCLAGWFLAVLNIAGAALGRGSIFQWSDLPPISLWHMILWSIGGLALGAGTILFNGIRNRSPKINPSGTAILLLYAAFWFYFFGQSNIRVLTGLLSLRALLWNGLMITGGLALLIVLVRAMRRMSSRFTQSALTSAIILLTIITLLSTASSLLNSTGKKAGASSGTDRAGNRINVLFILLDAVRADHLSCYGYERETTPHIDRLAAGGILFEKAFSQSSHTLESVASYMTSTYPSTHTVRTQTSALPRRIRTLPDLFHADGYATAVFSANPYVSAVYGYGRGVEDFYWPEGNKVKINKTVLGHMLQSAKTVSALKKPAAALLELGQLFYSKKNTLQGGDPAYLTDKALTWMKDHADRPFFLYLHYDGGHNPYLAPDPSLFDPDYMGTPVTNFPEGLGLFYPAVKGRPLAPDKMRNMIAQYDGQIHHHDSNLGRLFEYLNASDLGKNTAVIVTSDHGEEFYEHEGWGHGQSLFDETIHVPLILDLPGILLEGRRYPHLVELTDIAPTLLQLCSIRSLRDLDYSLGGKSLLTSLDKPDPDPLRPFIYSELQQGGHSATCLRSPLLKTIKIHYEGKVLRLAFDLTQDINEIHPLDEKDGGAAASQFIQLDRVEGKARSRAFRGKSTLLDEKQKEQLRSLGYIK